MRLATRDYIVLAICGVVAAWAWVFLFLFWPNLAGLSVRFAAGKALLPHDALRAADAGWLLAMNIVAAMATVLVLRRVYRVRFAAASTVFLIVVFVTFIGFIFSMSGVPKIEVVREMAPYWEFVVCLAVCILVIAKWHHA
jgi:hypothetical protein